MLEEKVLRLETELAKPKVRQILFYILYTSYRPDYLYLHYNIYR
jgi:hypothetical protein